MSSSDPVPWTVARAGARGLVAAMAMTGVRTVTANVGLVEQSPPEAVVTRHAPAGVQRLRQRHRTALTELAHWSYGVTGGVIFGLLPSRVRAQPWTGPSYGLAIWVVFEVAVAPLLGVQRTRQRGILSRAVIAADHVLYGLVVAGRLAPEPQVIARERGHTASRGRGAGRSGTAPSASLAERRRRHLRPRR